MTKDSIIQEIHELPQTGLLRIKQVLQFIPVSRSHFWAGVKSGKYPKPLKLSERVTVWKAADIRALAEGIKPCTPSISNAVRQGGELC